MALTLEQQKRVDENRRRALEIRQQKDKEIAEITNSSVTLSVGHFDVSGGFFPSKTPDDELKKKNNSESQILPRLIGTPINSNSKFESERDDESLEDFEYNASQYISKSEAQTVYCLPLGTLAVCSNIERENPHKRGWSKMKLYIRSEVRWRARKRYGGKKGLAREREERKEKKLRKDLEEMGNVFR